jgi:hypothetical protein
MAALKIAMLLWGKRLCIIGLEQQFLVNTKTPARSRVFMSLVQVVLLLVGYPENDGETREHPLGSRQRFDFNATSWH